MQRTLPLLILAGGRATRLGALSDECPKFLAPVSHDKVFADVQLHWAKQHRFSDVILSVGYRGTQIRAYCGDGARYGLQITYVFDGDTPPGTGGAVRKALYGVSDYAAVLYGDTILDIRLYQDLECILPHDQ